MTIEVYLAYAFTVAVIVVIPGPTILAVSAQSLAHGRPATLPLVLGVTCGDILGLALSIAGLGALLATSAALFTVLKWAGAGYLIYLGVMMWRDSLRKSGGALGKAIDAPASASTAASSSKPFMHAFVVTTFNPKGIIFFIAFLPQFVNPEAGAPLQLFILAATFVLLGSLSALMYALFSAGMKSVLEKNNARRWVERGGGTALFAAGAWALSAQRN
ncbi:MAG: LysE family translocator [Gammaproteobacteria bacterium]|nr:LysE family translocator [Gammaproteobacteria bacterium]